MTVLKKPGRKELLLFLLKFVLLLVAAQSPGIVATRLGLPSVGG